VLSGYGNPYRNPNVFKVDATTNTVLPPGVEEEIVTDLKQIHSIGTFAKIKNLMESPHGIGMTILLQGFKRIAIQNVDNFGPPMRVQV